MVESGSHSAKEVLHGKPGDSGERAPFADFGDFGIRPSHNAGLAKLAVSQADSPAEALSRSITDHKRQLAEQSWMGAGLSYLTEPIHQSGANLKKLEALQEKASKESSPELDKEITRAIGADRSSLKTQSEIELYGGGMLQTAGLFMGSKKGLAYTALAFGLNTARPADSVGTQALDFTLGASKGAATGLLFHNVMKSNADVATKALTMGVGNRFVDASLSRQTYINPENGKLDVTGAFGRIGARSADPAGLAMDVAVFGTGQAILQNQAIRGAIQKNALTATMTTAGAFGFASGSGDEISKQLKSGEFDAGAIVTRGLLRGGTDAIASIPGGMRASRLAAMQRESSLGLTRNPAATVEAVADPAQLARAVRETGSGAKLETSQLHGKPGKGTELQISDETARFLAERQPVIERSWPATASREFQIVGGDVKGLDMLGQSKAAAAVVKVRELSNGQPVGDTKRMLVQHVDDRTPLRTNLASTVDLVASCNPGLCGPSASKHLFGDRIGVGSVFFQKVADRLSFSTDRTAVSTANGAAVELGRTSTVSDLLLLPETKNLLRTPRPVELYAREMKHFKDPALRVVDAGADSIVFELADGRILKMTDRPYRKDGQPLWRPEWGSRTYETDNGVFRFDARLMTKPTQIEVNHEPIMYYIQERAQTPVSTRTLREFHDNIARDGNYVFWDGGFSSLGHAQLGYVPTKTGGKGVVLLDYDAVRKPGDVPPETQLSPGSDNHWMSRYRADRIDWER